MHMLVRPQMMWGFHKYKLEPWGRPTAPGGCTENPPWVGLVPKRLILVCVLTSPLNPTAVSQSLALAPLAAALCCYEVKSVQLYEAHHRLITQQRRADKATASWPPRPSKCPSSSRARRAPCRRRRRCAPCPPRPRPCRAPVVSLCRPACAAPARGWR